MKKSEAIILAGGLGTRLRPALFGLPKALAPVAGRPFLHLMLERLAASNFGRIILATGYLADKIEESIGSVYKNMEIVYSREETPLGTGGALAKALVLAESDYAFAMNGDTMVDADYQAAMALYKKGQPLVMYGTHVSDCSRFGRLVFSGNEVCGMEEKGVSGPGWINAGVYLLSKSIFNEFQMPERFSFERDFLPCYLRAIPAGFIKVTGAFHDIGTPETLQNFIMAQSRQ